MKNILNSILGFIYPEECGFCGKEIENGKYICFECASLVKLLDCNGYKSKEYQHLYFDKIFYAGKYEGVSRDGILRLKRSFCFNSAKYFCVKLCQNITDAGLADKIDVVTYVPMSWLKKNKIGYDQAEQIAKIMSKSLGRPLLKGAIVRKHTQASQHSRRTPEERRVLANKVYSPPRKKKDLSGKTILLCDDVLTSGNTLSRCAAILKSQGAKAVYAAVLVHH